MGAEDKNTSPEESEESESAATPRPVTLRPRGVDDVPAVPQPKDEADASKEELAKRPTIPLKPRKIEAPIPVVELDSDPPGAPPEEEDSESLGEVPKSEDPAAESPGTESTDDNSVAGGQLRPRGLADVDISTIKERAATNLEAGAQLPEKAPVALKPRPTKSNPNAEVEIIESGDSEGSPSDDDEEEHVRLQDRKSGVSRLLSDEEFELHAGALQEKEIPRWERDGDEAEGNSSEEETVTLLMPAGEGKDGYEWVTVTPDELLTPGARLRKKIFKRGTLALLAIVIFAAIVSFGRHTILAMRKAELREKMEAVAEPLTLTDEEISMAEEAARTFAAATEHDEILKIVRTPLRVAPLMKSFYEGQPIPELKIGKRLREKKLVFPFGVFVVLAFETEGQDRPFWFITAERSAQGTYRVDWELSSGYQEALIDNFLEERPTSSRSLRVVARPDNYYDNSYPVDEFACYRINYPGKSDFELYGYVQRSSQINDILLVNTANRSLSMILDLKFQEDPLRKDRVVITDVVKLDWFYAQAEE